MGSNGGEHTKISGTDAAECSETTIEIKIKTLDSQTFTLHVDKCVPVHVLKGKIASLTGVLSEQQHLICRGKVLKDDHLLSAYHVEDGHTLHLIVRQPSAPSPESSSDCPAVDTTATGNSPGTQEGPGMLLRTFNISELGDLSQIISAILSFGITRIGTGHEGIDLNQHPSDRLSTGPGLSDLRSSNSLQSDQAASRAVPLGSVQPLIIPDSLTTLLQYLSHLRREFLANAGEQNANSRNVGLPRSDGHVSRGVPMLEFLAEVISSTRQLLAEEATECLSQLAAQLECNSSMTDALERSIFQSDAIRSGSLIRNLGALLLELGRAIMTLRMGQTPADALVNAGPSVFISSTRPNSIMVQPLPFQSGASYGSIPFGTVQQDSMLSGGSLSPTFLPRRIEIRISGSLFSRRQPTDSHPQGQGAPGSPNTVGSSQQDAAPLDSNSHNSEHRALGISFRAYIGSSVRHGSDSSRGSTGILYPFSARVQNVTSANPNGASVSQVSDQHQGPDGNTEKRMPDPAATQHQNTGIVRENGGCSPAEVLNDQGFTSTMPSGPEQLPRTIFPGQHSHGDNSNLFPTASGSGSVAQDVDNSQEAASTVSDEGILLSDILHQAMTTISENTGAGSNMHSTEGANSFEPQAAGENPEQGVASSRRRRSRQSQQNMRRQRRE